MLNKFAYLLIVLLAAASIAEARTDVEIVLDASGSMRAAMAGSTQMDVAKQTIKSTIATIPADTHVALRVYAHRIEQTDKAGSCVDTELLIPFGPLNVGAFSAKVDSIQPKGYTPIAYSLQQVASDFGAEREAEKVVILVSDGEETCGGDPVQAVRDLIAKGFKMKLHAVGFNVDPKTQAQLQAIAAAGGGQYYDARDPAGLASSLKDITEKALVAPKTAAVYGTEIKGGDSYETAVVLTPGQEYRLSHHLMKNQFDYFYVDLKGGQNLTVTMNTRQKGINVKEGNVAVENDNPYAGFQIHDSTRKKIAGKELIGSPNRTESDQISAATPQRMYLLVGSTYDNMHKDHPFKLEVKDFFDAGSGGDAPDNFEGALALEKGKAYPENYFTVKTDEADIFKVSTTKGEAVTAQVLPENLKARLQITLLDDMRVELGKGIAPNEGAGLRVSGTATGPTTFVRVGLHFTGDVDTKYSVTVEGAGGAPVGPATQPTTQPTGAETVPAVTPPPPPPPPVAAPPPPPPVQIVEKVVEKVVEKPAKFKWTSKDALKMLGAFTGGGFLLGLIVGVVLGKVFFGKKKETPGT